MSEQETLIEKLKEALTLSGLSLAEINRAVSKTGATIQNTRSKVEIWADVFSHKEVPEGVPSTFLVIQCQLGRNPSPTPAFKEYLLEESFKLLKGRLYLRNKRFGIKHILLPSATAIDIYTTISVIGSQAATYLEDIADKFFEDKNIEL